MTRIVVSTEVEYSGPFDAEDSSEPYSYRGETWGSLTNVVAAVEDERRTYYGDGLGKDLDVNAGDTVYAVVVVYTTGDSFGRDGGQTKVLDAFTDPAEAAALAQRATEHDSNKDGYGFQHNGVDYYTPWCGYFESLDSIDVWDVQVRGPFFTKRAPEHVQWNIRRGH